jgi:hypothetical protein
MQSEKKKSSVSINAEKTNNAPNYVERFKVPTVLTGSKLSIFSHPGKITGYWITTRSFPYRDPCFTPSLHHV